MIAARELDLRLADEIMAEPGGEHLLTCWSCGTCAATCLVRRFNPAFNPRRILHQAGLGLRQQVLSSAEIWQCSACDACYPRCPQQIHISQVMQAIRNVALREGYQAPGPCAQVEAATCSGCAVCTRACPYKAIERVTQRMDGQERAVAYVDGNLCQRCGICVAVCPSRAIRLEEFNDSELLTRIGADGWLERPGWLQGGAEAPRILALVCQWSIRSEVEWAGLQALQSDALRLVNLPCSGRVDPAMILLALNQSADGVLVVGCREGECHYQRGTYLGRGKVMLLREMMAALGLPPERVRFAELGALDRDALRPLVAQFRQCLTEVLTVALRGMP